MVKETNSSIKKKRKTTGTDNDAETDIYKKVVDFEEKESTNRESSMDASIYFSMCQDIKATLKDIYERKCLKTVDVTGNKEGLTDICIKLCIIKKLNRIDKIKHVFGKETLSAEKQKCDSIKLSYQNLVYELHHLVAETNKCLAFKSKDEEIELVSFEEFMKEAPESLTQKFKNYSESNAEERHNLRLARLEWELTQRKNLAEMCKSLVEEQKKLEQDIVERKEKLNMLRPLLMNIINATKPLQEHLDVAFDQLRGEHKLAFLLPDPLYIFYVNVVSYKNVYNLSLVINILGDQDEAMVFKEAQEVSTSSQNDEDSEQESDLPEVEEVVEVKKRRHRKSVQQVDPMEEKKKQLLERHPLSVEIIASIEKGPSITATFHYYTKLKIITVTSKVNIPSNITANTAREILSGDNILGELKEGDFGTDSPSPTTPFQLKKIGVNSYQSLVAEIGYAYTWAQGVCGLDFLSKQKLDSDSVSSANVESVVKVLLKRLAARNDLAKQLQQLEQNIIPKIPTSVEAPSNPVSALVKWSSTTYPSFCQSEFTQSLVEEELVSSSDLYYSATIRRGNANMQALIVLKNNYPEVPPILSLCLNYNGAYHSANCDDIRDLERILNTEWKRGEASSSWLLSAQIYYLCCYMDVYLESVDPKVFPQNSMFLKSICGRNRKRPFKFTKVGTGLFSQY
ncbi:hypothetical protein NQ315_016181 [Exocentrus adspersus]|uniref:THO complex subunit 5 n=1 Tax=Exocentrus adspersus TaxID=1586481 RepID=A0AAV8VGC8_9CUCU|nr:hypothetical protein NQ315_016181 [Exocentrus adspersus]